MGGVACRAVGKQVVKVTRGEAGRHSGEENAQGVESNEASNSKLEDEERIYQGVITGPFELLLLHGCSVPLLEAASDDVVAELAEVLDRRVSLSDLVDLGILLVVKLGTALRLKLSI